jgi:hypothetical protein
MNGQQCFEVWAGEHEWSDWTKPTLFASGFGERAPRDDKGRRFLANAEKVVESLTTRNLLPTASDGSHNCIVVDCPGDVAIAGGALLAARGFAPVVLFNGVTSAAKPLLRNDEVLDALACLAQDLHVAPGAPPAFLLDSRRHLGVPSPGWYDNRWLTFPQDFPSAGRLLVSGIKHCYLIAEPHRVADDLAHVLRRWQDAGIEIRDGNAHVATTLDIKKPLWFKQLFYRWVALSGLSANAFGGFGGTTPNSPGGGGFYYG